MKSFIYGKQTIEYTLLQANRKTLAITVKPDLSVEVRAPEGSEETTIESIVRKRASWIVCQQRFFRQFLPRTPERQFVSGETHLYLGRQYRLRIREAESDAVKLIAGYIYVHTQKTCDQDHLRHLLKHWYLKHAEVQFHIRLKVCLKIIDSWQIQPPQITVSELTSSWGKCSSNGKITLNLNLIRAPRACIDYVILHELCHLRCPNHSTEFYRLLSIVLPDWKESKLRLEKVLS